MYRKSEKVHTVSEELILPADKDILETILYYSALLSVLDCGLLLKKL